MLAALGVMAAAQNQRVDNVEVHVLPVQGNVYMVVAAGGAGGNVTALQAGPDGVLLVDTSLEQMSSKIVAAIRTLSDKPIRYIINTHAHPDHVGGNAPIAALGATIAGGNMGTSVNNGAAILAHENVLKRMSAPTGQQAPTVEGGLAHRHVISRRRRSCSSTASRSRSCTSRRRTPTATASSSSAIPMSSPPAICS